MEYTIIMEYANITQHDIVLITKCKHKLSLSLSLSIYIYIYIYAIYIYIYTLMTVLTLLKRVITSQ